MGLAVGVDDIAHRRLQADGDQPQGQGLEVFPGDVADRRVEAHEVEEGRHENGTGQENDDCKAQAQVQALHDVRRDFFGPFRTPELGDDRRDAEENTAQAGKDGIPDIDGHGDAGQVDRPGAAAENRTENGRPDLGHLRQEQGEEQDQEMAQLK